MNNSRGNDSEDRDKQRMSESRSFIHGTLSIQETSSIKIRCLQVLLEKIIMRKFQESMIRLVNLKKLFQQKQMKSKLMFRVLENATSRIQRSYFKIIKETKPTNYKAAHMIHDGIEKIIKKRKEKFFSKIKSNSVIINYEEEKSQNDSNPTFWEATQENPSMPEPIETLQDEIFGTKQSSAKKKKTYEKVMTNLGRESFKKYKAAEGDMEEQMKLSSAAKDALHKIQKYDGNKYKFNHQINIIQQELKRMKGAKRKKRYTEETKYDNEYTLSTIIHLFRILNSFKNQETLFREKSKEIKPKNIYALKRQEEIQRLQTIIKSHMFKKEDGKVKQYIQFLIAKYQSEPKLNNSIHLYHYLKEKILEYDRINQKLKNAKQQLERFRQINSQLNTNLLKLKEEIQTIFQKEKRAKEYLKNCECLKKKCEEALKREKKSSVHYEELQTQNKDLNSIRKELDQIKNKLLQKNEQVIEFNNHFHEMTKFSKSLKNILESEDYEETIDSMMNFIEDHENEKFFESDKLIVNCFLNFLVQKQYEKVNKYKEKANVLENIETQLKIIVNKKEFNQEISGQLKKIEEFFPILGTLFSILQNQSERREKRLQENLENEYLQRFNKQKQIIKVLIQGQQAILNETQSIKKKIQEDENSQCFLTDKQPVLNCEANENNSQISVKNQERFEQMDRLNQENQNLKISISNLKNEINLMKKDQENLQKKNEHIQQLLDDLSLKYTQLENELAIIQKENLELDRKLEERDNKVANIELMLVESLRIKQNSVDLEKQFLVLKEECLQQTIKKSAEIAEMEEVLQEKIESLLKLEKLNFQMMEENKQLRGQLVRMQQSHQDLKQQTKSMNLVLKERQNEVEEIVGKLKNESEEKQRKEKQLLQKNEQVQAFKTKQEAMILSIQKQVSELVNSNYQLKIQLQNCNKDNEELTSELEADKQIIEKLQNQLQQTNTDMNVVKEANFKYQNVVEKFIQMQKVLRVEIQTLKSKIQNYNKEKDHHNLQSQYKDKIKNLLVENIQKQKKVQYFENKLDHEIASSERTLSHLHELLQKLQDVLFQGEIIETSDEIQILEMILDGTKAIMERKKKLQKKISFLQNHTHRLGRNCSDMINYFLLLHEKMEHLMKFLVGENYILNPSKFIEFKKRTNIHLIRVDDEQYMKKWLQFMKELFHDVHTYKR